MAPFSEVDRYDKVASIIKYCHGQRSPEFCWLVTLLSTFPAKSYALDRDMKTNQSEIDETELRLFVDTIFSELRQ